MFPFSEEDEWKKCMLGLIDDVKERMSSLFEKRCRPCALKQFRAFDKCDSNRS